jgi:hypothetical protein
MDSCYHSVRRYLLFLPLSNETGNVYSLMCYVKLLMTSLDVYYAYQNENNIMKLVKSFRRESQYCVKSFIWYMDNLCKFDLLWINKPENKKYETFLTEVLHI